MSEHEHAAVLEERWRTGFTRSLGALDQRVQRAFDGIAGIEEKVDRRVGGVEEQLTQLNIRLAQMLPPSAQRLPHAPRAAGAVDWRRGDARGGVHVAGMEEVEEKCDASYCA